MPLILIGAIFGVGTMVGKAIKRGEQGRLFSPFSWGGARKEQGGRRSVTASDTFPIVNARKGRKEGWGYRIVHFSVQTNHIHCIVEARDNEALASGMHGLVVRVARGLNRLWKRCGKLFPERYHAVVLAGPRQVRNAIRYVLNNARDHGHRIVEALDRFASGRWFGGWLNGPGRGAAFDVDSPVAPPTTWLLREGWQRRGDLSTPSESPASVVLSVTPSQKRRPRYGPGTAARPDSIWPPTAAVEPLAQRVRAADADRPLWNL